MRQEVTKKILIKIRRKKIEGEKKSDKYKEIMTGKDLRINREREGMNKGREKIKGGKERRL